MTKAIIINTAPLALGIILVGLPSHAAEDPNHPPPTWAEFQKLQTEVREQRQLILELMCNEQQRYDMLLRLIGSGSQLPSGEKPVLPPAPPAASSASRSSERAAASSERMTNEAPNRTGSVEGKIT